MPFDWNGVNLNQVYLSYMVMLNKYEIADYCITLKTTSEKAAPEIDSIDILYIDGNHSEASSLLDVNLYLPKVHSGGYIWFDDASWPRTQKARDLLLESCDYVKSIDDGNCILLKKR